MLNYINKSQSGFTLIEIAVVLVIVGMLVGSFIGSFSERIDSSNRDATKNELDEIKRALAAFVYSSAGPFSLPCPDTDVPPDGISNPLVGGGCAAGTAVGVFPWVTLGMGRMDSWGAHYSYWVDNSYANNVTGFTLDTDTASSAQVNTRVNNVVSPVATNAVAVIFSRGKNGYGGISSEGINRPAIPMPGHSDEMENANANSVFISRHRTDEGAAAVGGAFDDILVWINVFELKAKMVETGKLP